MIPGPMARTVIEPANTCHRTTLVSLFLNKLIAYRIE